MRRIIWTTVCKIFRIAFRQKKRRPYLESSFTWNLIGQSTVILRIWFWQTHLAKIFKCVKTRLTGFFLWICKWNCHFRMGDGFQWIGTRFIRNMQFSVPFFDRRSIARSTHFIGFWTRHGAQTHTHTEYNLHVGCSASNAWRRHNALAKFWTFVK